MFKNISATVLSVLLVVALGGCFAFYSMWQTEKLRHLKTTNDYSVFRKDVVEDKNKYMMEFAAIREEANRWEREYRISLENYQKEINDVKTLHDNAIATVNSLRNAAQNHKSTVSTIPRETVEKIAVVGIDNSSECAAVTVELEKLIREYNAEIEFLLASWPTNPKELEVKEQTNIR